MNVKVNCTVFSLNCRCKEGSGNYNYWNPMAAPHNVAQHRNVCLFASIATVAGRNTVLNRTDIGIKD